jgi:4-hydroxybenzoate polyprenyltransferase
MNRWWTFIKERFQPVSHLLMIGLFSAAHAIAATRIAETSSDSPGTGAAWLPLLVILPGVVTFFFLLRLYDEVKDYKYDCHVNPHRPLSRGLVSQQELKNGMAVCFVISLVSFGATGRPALGAITLALTYSLLMYREFFLGTWLRPKLTTYAVSHTAVSVFLSVAIFSALTGRYPWALSRGHWLFAANSWLLFNIFEFGRKSFLTSEERDAVPSYSKVFSRYGAVALVLAMAAISLALLWGFLPSPQATSPGGPIPVSATQGLMVALAVLLAAVGLGYAAINRPPWGKIYRGISSAYIMLVYGAFVVGLVISPR